ncbi:aldehyde dehydrogenase family protein, partial [Streptomyces rubiginosohelvolus]
MSTTTTATRLLNPAQWAGRIWTGEWTSGADGEHSVHSPSTGTLLATIGFASPDQVDAAAEAAAAAQQDWAARSYEERAAVLRR